MFEAEVIGYICDYKYWRTKTLWHQCLSNLLMIINLNFLLFYVIIYIYLHFNALKQTTQWIRSAAWNCFFEAQYICRSAWFWNQTYQLLWSLSRAILFLFGVVEVGEHMHDSPWIKDFIKTWSVIWVFVISLLLTTCFSDVLLLSLHFSHAF